MLLVVYDNWVYEKEKKIEERYLLFISAEYIERKIKVEDRIVLNSW